MWIGAMVVVGEASMKDDLVMIWFGHLGLSK
jgi:hypothetical protein